MRTGLFLVSLLTEVNAGRINPDLSIAASGLGAAEVKGIPSGCGCKFKAVRLGICSADPQAAWLADRVRRYSTIGKVSYANAEKGASDCANLRLPDEHPAQYEACASERVSCFKEEQEAAWCCPVASDGDASAHVERVPRSAHGLAEPAAKDVHTISNKSSHDKEELDHVFDDLDPNATHETKRHPGKPEHPHASSAHEKAPAAAEHTHASSEKEEHTTVEHTHEEAHDTAEHPHSSSTHGGAHETAEHSHSSSTHDGQHTASASSTTKADEDKPDPARTRLLIVPFLIFVVVTIVVIRM